MKIIDAITCRLFLIFPEIFGKFPEYIKFPENLQPYLHVSLYLRLTSPANCTVTWGK